MLLTVIFHLAIHPLLHCCCPLICCLFHYHLPFSLSPIPPPRRSSFHLPSSSYSSSSLAFTRLGFPNFPTFLPTSYFLTFLCHLTYFPLLHQLCSHHHCFIPPFSYSLFFPSLPGFFSFPFLNVHLPLSNKAALTYLRGLYER